MELASSIIVDLLGILGAILVAIPFFNESSLKEVRSKLASAIPMRGFERAEKAATETISTELSRFRRGDRACVIWGLATIGLSYGLHLLTEVIKYVRMG